MKDEITNRVEIEELAVSKVFGGKTYIYAIVRDGVVATFAATKAEAKRRATNERRSLRRIVVKKYGSVANAYHRY